MNPPIAPAAEQDLMAELTRANGIVDRLMQTSPNVIHLIHRLRENPGAEDRTFLEDQLVNEFEAALYQGGVPPEMVPALAQMHIGTIARSIRMVLTQHVDSIVPVMVPAFAQMHAGTTAKSIRMVLTQHGDSIVVYFLCKTVQSLYGLGQMITSGFMNAVRADEFNFRLLCLSLPQHKGLSIDRQ